jgi:hypothetical protein
MADLTDTRRVIAQRERDLRAENAWGMVDLVALPVAGIIVVLVFSLAIIPGIVTLIVGRLCKRDRLTSGGRANRKDPGS